MPWVSSGHLSYWSVYFCKNHRVTRKDQLPVLKIEESVDYWVDTTTVEIGALKQQCLDIIVPKMFFPTPAYNNFIVNLEFGLREKSPIHEMWWDAIPCPAQISTTVPIVENCLS